MWHNHPFCQRNKATKSAAVIGLCGGRGWSKFEKGGGGNRQFSRICPDHSNIVEGFALVKTPKDSFVV